MSHEKRRTKRFSWDKTVNIVHNKDSYKGQVKNVSLRGLLVSFDEVVVFGQGAIVDMEISLGDKGEGFVIKGRAKLKRALSKRQYAFEFISLDLDSFDILRKAAAYNLGGTEAVEEDGQNVFITFTRERK